MDKPFYSDVKLSKTLSWLLRHGAKTEGLPITSAGYVPVESILSHRCFLGRCTEEDILRLVQNDAKTRYSMTICPNTKQRLIKANQGHSIPEVSDLHLTKIQRASEIPLVVHGTFKKNVQSIQAEGLKTMKRNHIHFAASDQLQSKWRISGLRHNCEILIYINVELAINSVITY